MRRIALLASVVAIVLGLAAQTAAAQTIAFEAQFKGTQTAKRPNCPSILFFCGSGTVSGFGAAEYVLVPTAAPVPLPNGCSSVDAQATVTLRDGSGSLTLAIDGTVCFPGNSQEAPGALKSFGNPFTATGTFTISGGTGVFAGATGSGNATLKGAGAHNSVSATGTLNL
jgi:hypothetical protein